MTSTHRSGFQRRAFSSLCNLPGVRWFRTRTRRRALVAVAEVALGAFAAAAMMDAGLVAIGLSGLIVAIATIAVGGATYGLADLPMRSLDEQQRHMRLSMFSDPYAVGATVGVAGGMLIGANLGGERELVIVPFFIAIFALPAYVLAWKLPDEAADDEQG